MRDPDPTADPVLVVRELGWRQPEAAFQRLRSEPGLAWLDSAVASGDPRSRFSTLAVRPFRTIEARGRTVTIDGVAVPSDPFEALDRELARWRLPPALGPVPFRGGAIGLLGYELGTWLEALPRRHAPQPGVPDLHVALFDVVLGFDHLARRCWVLSSGFPEASGRARERRAEHRADELAALLDRPPPPPDPTLPRLDWRPELTRAEHRARVRHVLELIRAGDIFQANVTMRVAAARPHGLQDAAIHLGLRRAAPAPFAAFLRIGEAALASVSPERFLRLDTAGRVETRPIKGTRPRDPDPVLDAALRDELAASAKDAAENLMIVDLLRHDLGRVAELGSVRVPVLRAVETFSTVHHLVSVVEARLRPGLGAVDLLRAAFPGGSVTGAPKIRAMEIIDEVEASARGPYCGAVVAIGFDGAMDSSIVIRTLVIGPDTITAAAGGGIVAESEPEAEHEELWVKLAPLLRIFGAEDA